MAEYILKWCITTLYMFLLLFSFLLFSFCVAVFRICVKMCITVIRTNKWMGLCKIGQFFLMQNRIWVKLCCLVTHNYDSMQAKNRNDLKNRPVYLFISIYIILIILILGWNVTRTCEVHLIMTFWQKP